MTRTKTAIVIIVVALMAMVLGTLGWVIFK